MKLAIIPPTEHLELGDVGTIFFALAQFAFDNEDYVNYYRAKADEGLHVILDNGSFELGHSVDPTKLLEVAEAMNATEIVAPDTQWDAKKTLHDSIAFAKQFREQGYNTKYKLMSVVWANGPGDYLDWFQKHYTQVNPDRFGIGKWLENNYQLGTRMHLIYAIQRKWGLQPKDFHALGCPYPMEMELMRDVVWSMDTGLAAKAALNGILLAPQRHTPVPTVELGPLTDEQHSYAEINAWLLVQLANGEITY